MFGKIAAFEFRYQIRQPVFWVVAGLFGLMAFFTIAASDFISLGLPANVNKNAPFAIGEAMLLFGVLYMFVTTAFVANVVVRDEDTGFGPLIQTTRISKFDYLYGRFLGAFGAAVVSFSIVPLMLLIGSFMPWLDRETIGPVNLGHYAYTFVVFALPALLTTSAIFFALATVTRSMMWTYVGVVGLLVLYFARGMLLSAPELRPVGAVLDPFGFSAFSLATQYWTVAEMNTQLPAFDGLLAWNKALWLTVSVLLLAAAYGLYRTRSGPAKTRRAKAAAALASLARREEAQATPVRLDRLPRPSFTWRTALLQLWARTRLDMGQVFMSPAYFVLLIIGAAFAIFALWTVTNVSGYGGKIYPLTRIMLERLTSSFTIIPLIISLYYAGELVWREREKKTNEIVEASAAPGWAFILPKILAITLVLISTLTIGVVIAILIQVTKGYFNFEIGKYLLWLVLPQAVDFTLLAIFAVFIQTMSPNKFVGWALMVVYLIAQGTLVSIGWEHNLYNYGGTPAVPLSDMNGQGRFWIGAWWFRLYWSLFAVALVVLSYAVWQRGAEIRLLPRLRALPNRLRGVAGGILTAALIGFTGVGVWIYVNTNVWNEYRTQKSDEKWLADYEKTLGRYMDTPRPKIVSIKLDVDLYPHEPRATVLGSYIVENRTGDKLKEIHLAFDRDLKVKALSIQGGRPKQPYPAFNYRIFTLDTPMEPGERREITFTTERSQRGFRNSGGDNRIVDNGAFLNNMELAPRLGMEESGLLTDRSRRRKLGLPAERRPAKLGDVPSRQFNYLRHDADFVTSDITITTAADQIPMAPGKVVMDQTNGDRRKVRFVSQGAVMPFLSIQSARYRVAKQRYKDIDIAVYYDPQHPWNVQRITEAAKRSLDYYQANFSPYQFTELRMLEFPAYADFAQAFPGTMPWSEDLFFIADYRDPSKIDMVTYVGAHEIGHQWWAHQVIGADQQGSTALSETLAQYSALMVMKHMYGEDRIRKFLKFELDSYLRSRGGDPVGELPLARVEGQGYIHYRKGSLVMYRLQREIGEEAVNRALRRVIGANAFKGAPYPISLDLVSALRAEAPADKQALITDLFEKITLYDIQTKDVAVTKRKDGRYDVKLTVKARKLYADGQGKETEAPLAENLDVGLFTAMPGEPGFASGNIIAFEKRPIRSGTQTLTFVTSKAPTHAGVDPYNFLIDRNSDDNVTKAD